MFVDISLFKYYAIYILIHWLALGIGLKLLGRTLNKSPSNAGERDVKKNPTIYKIFAGLVFFGIPVLFFNVFEKIKDKHNRDYLIPKKLYPHWWVTVTVVVSSMILMGMTLNESKKFWVMWGNSLAFTLALAFFLSVSCKKCATVTPHPPVAGK